MSTAKYDDSWLVDCIRELELPGSPWYALRELVAVRLAERIRIEGLTYSQMTKVAKFVGKDFIRKHRLYEFVKRVDDSSDEFRRLQTEAEVQLFLKDLTAKAAMDANCPLRQSEMASRPKEYQEFVGLTTALLSATLDRKSKAATRKHVHADFNLDLGKDVSTAEQIIVNILQVDPKQIGNVVERMKGKVLPVQLRKYLYRLLLLKGRKSSSGLGSPMATPEPGDCDELTQQKIRQQFASQVKTGMQELKLQQATKSPFAHIIKSSIVEAFGSMLGLNDFAQNVNLQQETSRVLNILYTHSQKFEYYYVLWLFPLQASIYNETGSKEHDYDLAMWASLLMSEVLPSWQTIKKIAGAVWTKYSSHSERFGDELKDHFWALGIHSTKGELQESLTSDTLLHRSFSAIDSQISLRSDLGKQQTIHPVLCIRDWIMHIFVGNLKINVTLFLWDQLFLNGWDEASWERACMTLMICVSDEVFACKDKTNVLYVLTEQLYTLTLKDVIKVWQDCGV